MNKFWIPYISILISGTVAIYYYAPKCSATIMPFVPNWMKPQDPAWVLTTILTNIVSETVLPNESVQKIPLPQKEVLPEDKSFVSPAMEGIYYARSTEQPGWGVTPQKVSYYNSKGSHIGMIESGELLTCLKGSLTSSKGDLIECQPRSTTNSPVFIARKDAYFFTGDYNKLVAKQLQMLITYYQLNGQIAERRRSLLEERANLNPHFQASKTAYAALTKNIEEASQVQRQLASATGLNKMTLDDQLHALKMKEVGLKKTFESIQNDFVNWRTTHIDQLPRPENDPTIKAWQEEKQKRISSLPGLAF